MELCRAIMMIEILLCGTVSSNQNEVAQGSQSEAQSWVRKKMIGIS